MPAPATPLAWSMWGIASLTALALCLGAYWTPANPSLSPVGRADWSRLVDDKRDDHAHVASKVYSGQVQRADIVVLGNSSAREALWEEEILSKALRERGDARDLLDLSSTSQSLMEMLFWLHSSPPRARQTYVIFWGFTTLKSGTDFQSLEEGALLRSPSHLIREYPNSDLLPPHWRRPGYQALMHWRAQRQVLQRQIRFRFRYWVQELAYGISPPRYARYLYEGRSPLSSDASETFLRRMEAGFRAHSDANLVSRIRMLDVIASLVRNRGGTLVIAMPPELSAQTRSMYPREFAQFAGALQDWSERHAVEVIDLNQSVAWTRTDFYDPAHVSASGREKWSRALVGWLASR